jgi:inorganic pyrophosphatase
MHGHGRHQGLPGCFYLSLSFTRARPHPLSPHPHLPPTTLPPPFFRCSYFKRFQLKKRSTAARLDRVTTEATGDVNTLEYRLRFFYTEGGEKVEISPWHDVPLMNEDGTLNMIVEIPRWTRRKLEIATGEAYNPIRLDSKNGLPRILNYGDQLFNYGAFPQTWESPSLWTADNDGSGAEYHGDNDPIDVVEIGGRQQKCGSIIRVKVLGVLGLIDAGETDWKVFA